jgi:hypothetical protein
MCLTCNPCHSRKQSHCSSHHIDCYCTSCSCYSRKSKKYSLNRSCIGLCRNSSLLHSNRKSKHHYCSSEKHSHYHSCTSPHCNRHHHTQSMCGTWSSRMSWKHSLCLWSKSFHCNKIPFPLSIGHISYQCMTRMYSLSRTCRYTHCRDSLVSNCMTSILS